MVEIDRPAGCIHPQIENMVYPLHYGLVPGTRAEDGTAIEIYVVDPVGVINPATVFEATVVAIVHRKEGGGDKLVVSSTGLVPSLQEITSAVEFQEQWFKHDIEVLRA